MKRVLALSVALIMSLALVVVQAGASPKDLGMPERVLTDKASQAISGLDSGQRISLIVTFSNDAERDGILEKLGFETNLSLSRLPISFASGTAAQWLELSRVEGVLGIETNEQQELYMETARKSTRVQEVGSGAIIYGGSPLPLDGSGVGVAAIDTGTDATHPDLTNRQVPGRNLRNAPGTTVFTNVSNSDEHVGHGTHVAGIMVGDGTASGGRVRGVAPGASLYTYSHGAVAAVVGFLTAMDHILANPQAPGYPAIKVVNNSYGGTGSPTAGMTTALRALVNAGITVVFAAGNDGNGGETVDNTNASCKVKDTSGNPLKGLICVANYSEGELGTSEGGIALSSSRGPQSTPANWADIAAPGSDIEATRSSTGFVVSAPAFASKYGTTQLPEYITISGTSMAAPHVAGVVALLHQAAATAGTSLTPAQIEDIIKSTAHKFGNYAPYPNRHAGHGLVDARAAAETVLGLVKSPMTSSLRIYSNKFLGIVFTGQGAVAGQSTNVNAGAAGSTINDVLELEGIDESVDLNYTTPGATSATAGLIPYDVGATSLIVVQSSMTVWAKVTYLGSGTVAFDGPIALNPAGVRFQSPNLPYSVADGDVKAEFTVDVQGDGIFNPYTDALVTVIYKRVA